MGLQSPSPLSLALLFACIDLESGRWMVAAKQLTKTWDSNKNKTAKERVFWRNNKDLARLGVAWSLALGECLGRVQKMSENYSSEEPEPVS